MTHPIFHASGECTTEPLQPMNLGNRTYIWPQRFPGQYILFLIHFLCGSKIFFAWFIARCISSVSLASINPMYVVMSLYSIFDCSILSSYQQKGQGSSFPPDLRAEWAIWLHGGLDACTKSPYCGGPGQLLLSCFRYCAAEGGSGKERGK